MDISVLEYCALSSGYGDTGYFTGLPARQPAEFWQTICLVMESPRHPDHPEVLADTILSLVRVGNRRLQVRDNLWGILADLYPHINEQQRRLADMLYPWFLQEMEAAGLQPRFDWHSPAGEV